MTYSIIGILATVVLLINNRDVLWIKDEYSMVPTYRAYCHLLYGILAYLITDMLWGILEAHKLITANYIDTVIKERLTKLKIQYYRQLSPPLLPND